MIYFQSLTRENLVELLLSFEAIHTSSEKLQKKARYHARQLFHWVYQRHETDWDRMSDLSKALREWLKERVEIFQPKVLEQQQASDGTRKFLWQFLDGKTVESVLMPFERRLTACISSQVGCAMACQFCLTGAQGLVRNLQVHEIVAQVGELRRLAAVTHLVFMGMGEPLHNFEAVVQACRILLDEDGFGFSRRRITISTSGLVPKIDALGQSGLEVSLAISLNATTDEQRSQLMPVNRRWNLKELLDACRRYPLKSHRWITFEYVLIRGVNDFLEDAQRLSILTDAVPSKINLIPFNEHVGSTWKRPSEETIRTFQKYLIEHQKIATIRYSRGPEISAACGQLRSQQEKLAV